MKISTIEPFVVSHKLEREFYFSQWRYDTRTICLVKITCDDGTFGWGEGYGPAEVVKAGIEFFRPLLIGRSPLETESLWRMMYLRSLDYARRGILLSALSAIDVGLWDLKGRILGQSVSVLLGGRRRRSVRTYATGMYFTETESLSKRLAAEALGYREQGFDAMKMKVGLTVEKDIENVKAVRQAIGSDIDLMIDAGLTTATGSLTVSMVTTSSIVASMLGSLNMSPEMAVALIGAGSFCVFHANASFFWLLNRLHDIPPNVLYRTYTLQSLCMGLCGLLAVIILRVVGVR